MTLKRWIEVLLKPVKIALAEVDSPGSNTTSAIMAAYTGPFAMLSCKPRQARKGAAVTMDACAEMRLVLGCLQY